MYITQHQHNRSHGPRTGQGYGICYEYAITPANDAQACNTQGKTGEKIWLVFLISDLDILQWYQNWRQSYMLL